MGKLISFSVTVFLCVLIGLTSCHRLPNFLVQDDLTDGQHEIRIHYDGVSALQTSVGHDQGSESGLVLRQVSRNRHLVTMIYVGEVPKDSQGVEALSLRDCEVSSDHEAREAFLNKFKQDVRDAQQIQESGAIENSVFHNVSYVALDTEEDIPEYLRSALHFREIRALCKAHHRDVRRATKEQRKLEKAPKSLELSSDSSAVSSPAQSSSRSKRWVLNEFLILPGTKWCGNENLAVSFNDMSGYVGADHCCRTHDSCSINIPGFTRKYGIYNSRLTTISHCACDERFRACLKMSKTGAADMVGHVFFDVIKTRCFVFKKERVCKKWSWWGRCEKYRIEGVAHMRDPIPFST